MACRTPIIGRKRFVPPWPWAFPIEDDLPAVDYLAFAGSEKYPPEGICNFLRGATWTMSGSVSGTYPSNPRGYTAPITYSFSGLTSLTGTFYGYDTPSDPSPGVVGVPYTDLEDLAEFDGVATYDANVVTRCSMVDTYATTDSNGDPDSFFIDVSFEAYLPELVILAGVPTWRMKMGGFFTIYTTHGLTQTETFSGGLDFTDDDFPENDTLLGTHETGFSLSVSMARAASL